jgi:hypothetical protein
MGVSGGPNIIRDSSLVLELDAADRNSYPGSGTTWNDMSGNGNNGTLVNGPAFTSSNGGVISFDGINDYAIINNSSTLKMGGLSYTGEVWISITGSSTTERMIYEYNTWSNSGTYQLTTLTSTTISTTFPEAYAVGAQAATYTYSPLSSNIWVHISNQFDTTNNALRLYVNGTLTTQITGVTQEIGNITSNLYIMSRAGTSLFVPAKLGLLRIYNKALSASEILQNYNATKTRFGL